MSEKGIVQSLACSAGDSLFLDIGTKEYIKADGKIAIAQRKARIEHSISDTNRLANEAESADKVPICADKMPTNATKSATDETNVTKSATEHELTEDEKKILSVIKKNSQITQKKLHKATGISFCSSDDEEIIEEGVNNVKYMHLWYLSEISIRVWRCYRRPHTCIGQAFIADYIDISRQFHYNKRK